MLPAWRKRGASGSGGFDINQRVAGSSKRKTGRWEAFGGTLKSKDAVGGDATGPTEEPSLYPGESENLDVGEKERTGEEAGDWERKKAKVSNSKVS